MADKFADNIIYPFSFFYTLQAFFGSLENLQIYLLLLMILLKTQRYLIVLKILSEFPANPAMIAPTIMTDEIALVTDIKGV